MTRTTLSAEYANKAEAEKALHIAFRCVFGRGCKGPTNPFRIDERVVNDALVFDLVGPKSDLVFAFMEGIAWGMQIAEGEESTSGDVENQRLARQQRRLAKRR